MKYPFIAKTIILICMVVVACGQASQIAPTSSATILPTEIIPSQTATHQIEATPTVDINTLPTFSFLDPSLPSPTPNPKVPTFPTFIPTIKPNLVPELLSKSISIETLNVVNGHNIQRITGWSYGFRQRFCDGYQWLDSKHVILYPKTGEDLMPTPGGSTTRGDVSAEPVVINLTNGSLWLRPSWNTPASEWECNPIYWSRELGILISQGSYGSVVGPVKDAVGIYTFDGQEITRYWGKILGVSPSGTKILVDEDTIIDLRSNQITDLAWYMNYDLERSSKLYWSSDETQLYRCCFYYANLKTGKSYDFKWEDLRGVDGKPLPDPMRSPHTDGRWVRNDTYFFPTWNLMSDGGDPRVIFNPAIKQYYYIKLPSTLPIDPDTMTYRFSPDGMYVWITGFNRGDGITHDFLINLTTLETTSYDISTDEFEWSPDSKFACLTVSFDNGSSQIHLLSPSSKKLEPINLNSCPSWRPNDHLLTYLTEENQVLAILNPKDMSVKGWKLPSVFNDLIWSPDGNQLLLIAQDGSFWYVDYPQIDNFEQLTQPMSMQGVRDINWSPDGKSIAYVKDADIYIVDTTK